MNSIKVDAAAVQSAYRVLRHKCTAFQRAAQNLWQGAARRQYRAYWQGSQRRHRPFAARPSGGHKIADGRVAALANVQTFASDRALPSAVLRPLKGSAYVTQNTRCKVQAVRPPRMTAPNMRKRRKTAGVIAALCAICGLAGAASAQYQELDTIVAIVDEDVVLASELLSRLDTVQDQLARQGMEPPPRDVLLSQLMERLILENIQVQQALRRGVQIDDETLTRAVLGFAEQNEMSLEEFQQALVEDGMSYREFREQIRQEMLIQRLQRNMVNRRITISEQDVEDLLDSPYYQQLLSDEYRIGHILLAVEEGATEATVQAAAEKAQNIVTDLRRGGDFKQTAIAESAGARALEGGDLGWRRAGELPSLFAEQVLALAVGDTADPILSASGFHIVQLLERRGAGVQTADQTLARHILVQPSAIRTPAETEALIREIHRRLVDGDDFCGLAAEQSEDPGSALNCGDLGWSTGEQFVEAFVAAMYATPTGELSEPFQSAYGWHVLEVLDRRTQDMGEEARRNMAIQLLHQRRFEEELQKWLKEIRDEAFVEIRLPGA